ncbi:MAG: DNA gyrase subunit A [Saprospiraceae bacterium]|nr:DNA gyrase subunit A [Bacteroidia bacterium]NNE16117.1 DNA gyrase subunit A [Saprospiraceae bacterium]NNL91407.1 DNA gyrase subunit A [Saprospiraceae bacterium]
MAEDQRIIEVNIEDQMKSSYIDYSMSVIVSRALPDARDGLKPVHRRILYGMNDLGLAYNKPHKKSARVVGEVLGKYHPHGDSSVYDAMIRMGQPWSMRYPLVEIQGNKGSMDGDSPAAMRYTEARLERLSDELLDDIKKDTVDFRLNFDDSLEEPTVLPAKYPNLLINGASGIAVGMATNMLPHNISEVIDGTVAAIDNPDITIEELMDFVKAPDFPTGGIIYGIEGVREAFRTGRGRVVVRGRATIETSKTGRESIVITEIPFQLNKASLVVKIADLVTNERVTGISDIRDESDRKGLRIVVDIKRDAIANVVLSKLYKYTPLQSSYGVNNVALVNGRPEIMNLKSLISEFIRFRLEVIVRRTQFDLRKAEERAHILEGLIKAIDNLDEVIKIIRSSKTVDEAKQNLMAALDLSEIQSKAILEMRLQKLVSLEMEKLRKEYDELLITIADLKDILANEGRQREIIKTELGELKEKYGDERRTEITFGDGEINVEDMIPNDEVVVTISHLGYIKRTKVREYKTQGRGGRGSKGSKTRQEDFLEHIIVARNHNYILFFTERGRCFWLRIFEIPEGAKTGTGRVIQNVINIPKEDKVKAYILIEDLTDKEFLDSHSIVFATKNGVVKKTSVEAYSRPRVNGINAITIREDDNLIEAKLTDGTTNIMLANKFGRAIRFSEEKLRQMGRSAAGVRGMRIDTSQGDEIIGMIIDKEGDEDRAIMVISENGYGKRSTIDDYRLINRGGKGMKNIQITDKTGNVSTVKSVSEEDDILITTKNGIIIRMQVSDIRIMGRATQGVRVIKLDDKDAIADVAVVKKENSDEEE